MATPLKISVLPMTHADIPAVAKIGRTSFVTDKHTIVKQLGRKPFDMEEMSRTTLPSYLGFKHVVYRKAINEATGEVLGCCGWSTRGVNVEKVPWVDPGEEQPEVAKKEAGGKSGEKEEEKRPRDKIDELHDLEDADMKHWMEKLMPEGTQCMYILGLSVAPEAQSMGVGSALMEFGNQMADQLGLFTWVHSSEQAWKFYAKHGYEVVGELDVDLDEWAPRPPEEGEREGEGEDGKWGHYVIRYMKRLPK